MSAQQTKLQATVIALANTALMHLTYFIFTGIWGITGGLPQVGLVLLHGALQVVVPLVQFCVRQTEQMWSECLPI